MVKMKHKRKKRKIRNRKFFLDIWGFKKSFKRDYIEAKIFKRNKYKFF